MKRCCEDFPLFSKENMRCLGAIYPCAVVEMVDLPGYISGP